MSTIDDDVGAHQIQGKVYGCQFSITSVSRTRHPQAFRIPDDGEVFAVNGKVGPRIHLKQGNTYIFNYEGGLAGELFFTRDINGGPESLPIPGMPSTTNGSIFFVADKKTMPSSFYYQSRNWPDRGGLIIIK